MKLTLIGLPLGNYEDISIRAVKALDLADLIICEDSRVFYKLWAKLMHQSILNHKYLGKLRVINEFNEKTQAASLITDIDAATFPLLVSDAGMPTVSDPGFSLVNALLSSGGEIDIIPGPTAAMSALAASGFSSDRVLFVGFLPKKLVKRDKVWAMAKAASVDGGLTLIIYEAPNRVLETLKEAVDKIGDTPMVLARELTKEHQQILRGHISTLIIQISEKPPKGEVVLLFRL